MPSNLVWSWPLHCNSKISSICMGKDGLNRKRGHAIIGFNHGLPCYVKNMALGPQSRQKPRPTASVFVYQSHSGHVFNIAWQAMIETYNQPRDCLLTRLFRRRSKKTSNIRVTGLCEGNSPGTGEFRAQMASKAENVSISGRHHERSHKATTCFAFNFH